MAREGYGFLCVKGVANKPGHYTIIKPTPAFQIASGEARNDAGSLRKMLANKVTKVKRGEERAEAAEERTDPTLDYIKPLITSTVNLSRQIYQMDAASHLRISI